jgi:hypothetical protein
MLLQTVQRLIKTNGTNTLGEQGNESHFIGQHIVLYTIVQPYTVFIISTVRMVSKQTLPLRVASRPLT